MEDQPRLIRRTFKLEKAIDTENGERSILEATLEFDDTKGMFQVKSKLTTKQVSSNPGRMRLIQEAKSSLEKQLADLGIKLRQEWEAGHPDDQPELPFDEIGDSAAAFDLSRNGVAVTAEGPARRRSNAKQVAMPEGENE